jgi:predicted molibdopterin-dependent oxidoreductase YjgC
MTREEAFGRIVVERGDGFEFLVDGETLRAYAGETIAGALTAAGRRVFRHSEKTGSPRGVFCGIGICFECLVSVQGMGRVRSCMDDVQPGMHVHLTEQGATPSEDRPTD